MTLLTQSRFPTLWKIFQFCLGGSVDKRKLCRLKYKGQPRILEVGCSLGNIARGFVKIPHINYTGIDIDPVVIDYAQKDFVSQPNFRFLCEELPTFVQHSEEQFGYVLFAGVLHHVNDQLAQTMLDTARQLMPDDGALVVVEPLIPASEDHWFLHWFIKLEKGDHVRTGAEMAHLLQVPGLHLEEAEAHYVAASPFSWPKCARFGVYLLSKATVQAVT
jgi:SAM-dependent methyltransferase